MTYFAQKKTESGISLLAYFDTYSGKPMMNYPYSIRIDIQKNVADNLDTFFISVYKDNKLYVNADAMLVSSLERKADIERRILRIARMSLYEMNQVSKDNLDKTYNPRRDYREREAYSGTSNHKYSSLYGYDNFGEPIYRTCDGKFE